MSDRAAACDRQDGLLLGPDGRWRCAWHGGDETYAAYHDDEWGWPVADNRRLFEKICLEGFQAGLSWLTILRKRENFRTAFAHFDMYTVARFNEADIARCLADSGIVRHRGKIEATVNNARRALETVAEFGSLAAFFWSFEPPAAERPAGAEWATLGKIVQTPSSLKLSKALRGRGWRFVGPTTCYAFMQAMGLVNDHIEGCWRHTEIESARARFPRPR